MLHRLQRLNLTADMALFALLYEAYAWVIFPPLFMGYCTMGPAPTTLAYELAWSLHNHTWAVVLGLVVLAAVESRWTLRPWFVRASRTAAALGLLFLLVAPGVYIYGPQLLGGHLPPGPMATYW